MGKDSKAYLSVAVIMTAGILAPYPFTSIAAAFVCMCILETI